jgi:protoheme IX farnesyltransferase
LLAPIGALPWLLGTAGLAYGVTAIAGGALMVALSWKLCRSPDKRTAKQLFGISIVYLFVLFAALLVERALDLHHFGIPFGRVFA